MQGFRAYPRSAKRTAKGALRRPAILLTATLTLGIAPSGLWAQATTPSHAYQTVQTVLSEIRLLHEANFSDPEHGIAVRSVDNRLPRHVFQKAREVLADLHMLRRINGLPPQPLPELAAKPVTPEDVQDLVLDILAGVRELRPIFGVVSEPEAVALEEGRVPSDVYRELDVLAQMVRGLGTPPILPNDVYRVAHTVRREIRVLIGGPGADTTSTVPARDVAPADVYDSAHRLLGELANFVQSHPEWPVAGSIRPYPKHHGEIMPQDVLEVMNNVLAEVGAIRLAAGNTEPLALSAQPAGKTAADVYDEVELAISDLKGAMTQH